MKVDYNKDIFNKFYLILRFFTELLFDDKIMKNEHLNNVHSGNSKVKESSEKDDFLKCFEIEKPENVYGVSLDMYRYLAYSIWKLLEALKVPYKRQKINVCQTFFNNKLNETKKSNSKLFVNLNSLLYNITKESIDQDSSVMFEKTKTFFANREENVILVFNPNELSLGKLTITELQQVKDIFSIKNVPRIFNTLIVLLANLIYFKIDSEKFVSIDTLKNNNKCFDRLMYVLNGVEYGVFKEIGFDKFDDTKSYIGRISLLDGEINKNKKDKKIIFATIEYVYIIDIDKSIKNMVVLEKSMFDIVNRMYRFCLLYDSNDYKVTSDIDRECQYKAIILRKLFGLTAPNKDSFNDRGSIYENYYWLLRKAMINS